jgi:hypothetical protein
MIADTGNNVIRDFLFIVDPRSLSYMGHRLSWEVTQILGDLREIYKVDVQILFPKYLSDIGLPEHPGILRIFKVILEGPPAIFIFHKAVEKKLLKELGTLPKMDHELALLALAENMAADGIVTDSKLLISYQYAIYQYHRIRIIPFSEFRDTIHVVAVGNSFFWSAEHAREIGFDIYYPMTHWKAIRFFKWWSGLISSGVAKKGLVENLRSALLNRFPYILYSRDMVCFYRLQRDYYVRRGRLQMFGLAIGFYINTFYLMLWGMLEQLTIIAKHARELKVSERMCGIRSKAFWKEFRVVEKGLAAFIKRPNVEEWITVMADMRHRAAHNVIPIPSLLLNETADSRRSDEEIVVILRREEPHLYQFLDSKAIEALQPSWITAWRMRKMEIVAPGMVTFTKPDGSGYMRDPVISIDYDLSYLIGIMDAFLVKLFN